MSVERMMNDDWSSYDNRKLKADDRNFISFNEGWEVEYLKGKIRRIYPRASELQIHVAIVSCRNSVPAPHPRRKFMECLHPKLS